MHSHTVDPRREPVTSRRRTFPRSDTHALAVHEERRRLARELHDSVAQSLYGITLSASRLLTLLERSETAQAHTIINEVLRLANDSQTELRALVQDLRSDEFHDLPGGLTGALASQATALQAAAGCQVRLSLGDEPDLAPNTKATLARIAREALRNVTKHAQATRVDLVLEVGPSGVTLWVTDDGRGFDPYESRPGHFGLQLMREHAVAIGAAMELVSVPGQGTQVRVHVSRARD